VSTQDYSYTSVVSCPVGYTISGGSCINPVTLTVVKPADNALGVRRVGNSFVSDAADADVAAGTVAGLLAGVVSGSTATFGSMVLGKTASVELGGTGTGTITVTVPGTGGTSTVYRLGVGAPNGTTGVALVDGYSTGTVSGVGSLTDPDKPAGGEGCGAPGQPACKIDETGTATTKGATFTAGDAAADAAKAATLDAMTTFDAGTQTKAPGAGAFPSLVGSDSCVEPVTWTIGGNAVPLGLCAFYAPFKAVLGWLLWLGLAVFGWQRLTRGAITSGA
jgi:hypothetical protein